MPAILITIIWIGCAFWVISDVYKRTDKTNEKKLLWIILSVIPSIGIITAIAYYFLEKKDKQA
ncbi:MAG TPA: hypothetical protein PK029_02345 [Bacteroidales bacterium]|nr:MAG: hypothetical protein BWY22_00190 [Bacteroidetes bacterium ADurb.Bin217]HOS85418.1 hypothetical protein [Bacteroidales bacterium]HPH15983.1 hypothetical protein [Bacteroidales bacterium]HPM13763.1 hypothetical protein [Bacteroidales bacterium]